MHAADPFEVHLAPSSLADTRLPPGVQVKHPRRDDYHKPVLTLSLDGTGFHAALRGIGLLAFGELDLDGADLGETHPMTLSEHQQSREAARVTIT